MKSSNAMKFEEWVNISVNGDPWDVIRTTDGARYQHRLKHMGERTSQYLEGRPPTGPHAVNGEGWPPKW